MLCVLKSKEKCDGSPELQGPTVDTTIPVPITVKKTAPQKWSAHIYHQQSQDQKAINFLKYKHT